ARAGYRHLHFGPSDRRADGTPAVPEGATPEQLAALADLCARHGLAPTGMFPRRGGELAAETLETFRADVDTACALGVRTLIMWGPWPYRQGLVERRPRAEILARYEEWFAAMPALAAHAAKQGVMIALQPHAGLTPTSWGPRGHDDFPTPGDGEVDHRSMLTTLRADGFSGPCLVELVGGATPAETEQEARRAFAHLQDIIGS